MSITQHVEIDAGEERLNLRHLTPLLRQTRQYQDLLAALRRGGRRAKAQVLSDAIPFLATALLEDLPVPTVILVPRPEDARRLHERLTAWLDEPDSALLFPETETLPYERLVTDPDTVQQRICTLDALLNSHDPPPAGGRFDDLRRPAHAQPQVVQGNRPRAVRRPDDRPTRHPGIVE